MQNILLTLTLITLLASCSSKEVEINGKTYMKNEQGEIVLTSHDIDVLRKNRQVVIVDKVMPDHSVTVTSEELALISQDSELFEEKLTGKVNKDVFIFALKTGSLKANLVRLSDKFSTKDSTIQLNYGGVDYHISEPKILRSTSLALLVSDILFDYPVVTSIN
ncbi:MAG: hypothetical protein ACI87J_002322 [Colwellia sp.]|jgi:hypothetical protein